MYYARNDFTDEVLVADSAEDATAGAKGLWGEGVPFVIGEAKKYDPSMKVPTCYLAEYRFATDEVKVWPDPTEWKLAGKVALIGDNYWNDAWLVNKGSRIVARGENKRMALKLISDAIAHPDALVDSSEQHKKYDK